MSDQNRSPIGPTAKKDEADGFTRRTVLAGAAAATAAAAVAALDTPARAQSADANNRSDMVTFVLLSGALTGIAENKLAPGFDLLTHEPGSDAVDIKRDSFNSVN